MPMIDKSSIASLRKHAETQGALAQALSALAAELVRAAQKLPIEQREDYERRAVKLTTGASAASAQAIRASQAVLQASLAEIEIARGEQRPADPGLTLDEFKAKLAARKGLAQGGQ